MPDPDPATTPESVPASLGRAELLQRFEDDFGADPGGVADCYSYCWLHILFRLSINGLHYP